MRSRFRAPAVALLVALATACAAGTEAPPPPSTPPPIDPPAASASASAPLEAPEPPPPPPAAERASPPDPVATRALSTRVSALVEAARLGGRRSIVILDLASGVVLHDDSGATELVPASNTKLFTTAAALDTLGDDHRLETRLVARGTVDANGTLVGDLVLESGEDFTWSMRDDKHPGTIVDELVARAYATGLRRVDGQARAAGTFFVEGSRGAEYDERAHRATAGAMLANALQKQRIAVSRAKHPAGAPTALAAVASPPLLEAATIINRRSHNGFAEVLFRHLGARAGSTTSETGARALDSWLRSVSIDGARLVDGSGLSRDNRASAAAIARVLALMAERHPTFASTLAVAGESGTIGARMKGPDTRGRVLAKTGTLAEVTALAGYVDNRHDRRRYAFAIVLNGVRDIAGGRRLEDRIVEALAGPWNVPDVKAPP